MDLDDIELDEEETVEFDEEDEDDEDEHDEFEEEMTLEDVEKDVSCMHAMEDVMQTTIGTKKQQKKSKTHKSDKTNERRTWSPKEISSIERQFKKFILMMKVPGKLDCLNAMRKEKALANIDWKKIKFSVYNIIQRRKRQLV